MKTCFEHVLYLKLLRPNLEKQHYLDFFGAFDIEVKCWHENSRKGHIHSLNKVTPHFRSTKNDQHWNQL